MPRYDALYPLHQAIATTLTASSPVATKLGDVNGTPAIYSAGAPEGAPMPRVVIGFTIGTEFGSFDDPGCTFSVTLDVWTDGVGYSELLPLTSAIVTALRALNGVTLTAPPDGWPAGRTLKPQNVASELSGALLDFDVTSARQVMHGILRVTGSLVPA